MMHLIANTVDVIARSGNQKVKRLHPGIARAFSHDVKQSPVWLGVQLIKHHAVDVETMLRICFSRQHLIKAICRQVDEPLGRSQYLNSAV